MTPPAPWLSPISMLALAVGVLACADRAWKWWYADRFLTRWQPIDGAPVPEDRAAGGDGHASIDVLQPIVSGDPTMEGGIVRTVEAIAGPGVSFIWMVDEHDEAGQAICARVAALALLRGARRAEILVTQPAPQGVNPKSYKLRVAAGGTDGDFICVLDDDTVLPVGSLDRAVAALRRPGSGLAFGVPYYETWSTVWSRLVSGFVNGHSLTTYLPPLALTPPITVNGMFYVMPRAALAACGGFAAMERELADDYAISQLFARRGYALVQTDIRHPVNTTVFTLAQYAKLFKRWLRAPQVSIERGASGRERAIYYALAVLPACYPLVLTILALVAPGLVTAGAALSLASVILASAVHLNRRWLPGGTPWYGYAFVLLMQVLLPLHLLLTWVRRDTVTWRGNVLRLDAATGGMTYAARAGGVGEVAP